MWAWGGGWTPTSPRARTFAWCSSHHPGSQCSVIFGAGVTAAAPGSVQGLILVVDDIAAARAELVARGADVSGGVHDEGGCSFTPARSRAPGPDPKDFCVRQLGIVADPTAMLGCCKRSRRASPGVCSAGGSSPETSPLTDLLQEAEKRHGAYEATAPKHAWSAWYAAYMIARERGRTPDEAAGDAALHVKGGRS